MVPAAWAAIAGPATPPAVAARPATVRAVLRRMSVRMGMLLCVGGAVDALGGEGVAEVRREARGGRGDLLGRPGEV
ncbi:hypothetical protein TPA0907_22070 [Micromonospora humidisoli]|nr:hypothetical protein TPA0907_22070 [Micromonospora sp. AKA109]